MDIETIRRVSLARHLFHLGTSAMRSSNDLYLFAVVNLFQDAVEAFLLAVADTVGAGLEQHTAFDKYFVGIDNKIKPKELPFRLKLLRLNRIRVDAKHHGIQPARDECARMAITVREFFEEVSSSVLGVTFGTVSAIDLLEEGEPKRFLVEAKRAKETGDLQGCVVSCRKAIYVEFEKGSDISKFKDGEPPGLFDAFSDAPIFARNREYVQQVRDPTGFIVLDRTRLEQQLARKGVDIIAFWNVYGLTPEVYRTAEGEWIVKHEFHKLDENLDESTAEYVLSAAIDIFLAINASEKARREHSYQQVFATLAREGVPVYEKAHKESTVVATTPPGIKKVIARYRVTGLDGGGPYWLIFAKENGDLIVGYIHNDDLMQKLDA